MRRWRGAYLTLALVAACAGSDAPAADGDRTLPTDAPAATAATAPAGSGDIPTVTVAATLAGETNARPAATDPPDTTATTATTTMPVDLTGCAASLPRRDRIALLVWPAVYSTDWETAVRTVADEGVGGVVLMEPTGWGPGDLSAGLARLDGAAPHGLVIATDEEGGAVQRLSLLGPLPSQQAVSERDDLDSARQLIAEHGRRVADAGVDMVLGPVVDVVPEGGEVPLTRSRFFTGDPAAVAEHARAYIEGWRASGLSTVLKHYPGHGAASGDTHDEAGITPDLGELERRDLVPFRALADTGAAVMVGHLTVPGLTDGLPATRSERAVRYLRDELGYGDALVMTDALGMQAVGLAEDQAAVQALVAGIDVVIFTATGQTGPVIDAIEQAVDGGTLTDERITLSASRVLRYLDEDRRGCG